MKLKFNLINSIICIVLGILICVSIGCGCTNDKKLIEGFGYVPTAVLDHTTTSSVPAHTHVVPAPVVHVVPASTDETYMWNGIRWKGVARSDPADTACGNKICIRAAPPVAPAPVAPVVPASAPVVSKKPPIAPSQVATTTPSKSPYAGFLRGYGVGSNVGACSIYSDSSNTTFIFYSFYSNWIHMVKGTIDNSNKFTTIESRQSSGYTNLPDASSVMNLWNSSTKLSVALNYSVVNIIKGTCKYTSTSPHSVLVPAPVAPAHVAPVVPAHLAPVLPAHLAPVVPAPAPVSSSSSLLNSLKTNNMKLSYGFAGFSSDDCGTGLGSKGLLEPILADTFAYGSAANAMDSCAKNTSCGGIYTFSGSATIKSKNGTVMTPNHWYLLSNSYNIKFDTSNDVGGTRFITSKECITLTAPLPVPAHAHVAPVVPAHVIPAHVIPAHVVPVVPQPYVAPAHAPIAPAPTPVQQYLAPIPSPVQQHLPPHLQPYAAPIHAQSLPVAPSCRQNRLYDCNSSCSKDSSKYLGKFGENINRLIRKTCEKHPEKCGCKSCGC